MPPDPTPSSSSQQPAALQAPWRLEYLEALGRKEKQQGGPSTGSFLRDYWLAGAEADTANHVIVRTADTPEQAGGMILLNAFPYANGHLLVALGDARPTLLDYSPAQRAAFWRLTDCAAAILQTTLDPQGINFGINQGRAAGAGVPGHLHGHLVPRWGGDTNFMAAVGNIRVIPCSLDIMAERMRAVWAKIGPAWG
jgi:ATP adenylyltransferase